MNILSFEQQWTVIGALAEGAVVAIDSREVRNGLLAVGPNDEYCKIRLLSQKGGHAANRASQMRAVLLFDAVTNGAYGGLKAALTRGDIPPSARRSRIAGPGASGSVRDSERRRLPERRSLGPPKRRTDRRSGR